MIGTLIAIAIVFAILFVVSQSLGYYRGRLSVADTETTSGADVRQSAVLGASAGIIVLLLLALLYVGVTRWDWFGRPAPKPAVTAPIKDSPPPVLGGVGTTPSVPPAGASPSASPSK